MFGRKKQKSLDRSLAAVIKDVIALADDIMLGAPADVSAEALRGIEERALDPVLATLRREIEKQTSAATVALIAPPIEAEIRQAFGQRLALHAASPDRGVA